jgi:hypothetical protein
MVTRAPLSGDRAPAAHPGYSILGHADERPAGARSITDEGESPFQHYFVRRRCRPCVLDITYVGASERASVIWL